MTVEHWLRVLAALAHTVHWSSRLVSCSVLTPRSSMYLEGKEERSEGDSNTSRRETRTRRRMRLYDVSAEEMRRIEESEQRGQMAAVRREEGELMEQMVRMRRGRVEKKRRRRKERERKRDEERRGQNEELRNREKEKTTRKEEIKRITEERRHKECEEIRERHRRAGEEAENGRGDVEKERMEAAKALLFLSV